MTITVYRVRTVASSSPRCCLNAEVLCQFSCVFALVFCLWARRECILLETFMLSWWLSSQWIRFLLAEMMLSFFYPCVLSQERKIFTLYQHKESFFQAHQSDQHQSVQWWTDTLICVHQCSWMTGLLEIILSTVLHEITWSSSQGKWWVIPKTDFL